MDNLLDTLRNLMSRGGDTQTLSADPTEAPEAPEAETPYEDEPVSVEEVDRLLEELEVPEEHKEYIVSEYEAAPAHTANTLAEIIARDNSVNTWFENTLDIHGEVHGNVVQDNDLTETNATGDGAFAAGEDIHGVQAQSGDGVQVGYDNEGVANVGDNSGQQAGDDASVGGDFTSGDGNVHIEGSDINDSALAFGHGDATNEANDTWTEDSYNTREDTYNETITNTDSGNWTKTVDVNEEVAIDAHLTDSANYDESYVSDDDYKDIDKSFNEGEHDGDYEVHGS
ncbi:MAG: hypothetical protein ACFCVK_00430 [Acidimicrobiales bacterium]